MRDEIVYSTNSAPSAQRYLAFSEAFIAETTGVSTESLPMLPSIMCQYCLKKMSKGIALHIWMVSCLFKFVWLMS